MKMGLVGFPTVGKTTLFNILTDARAETSRFGTSPRAESHVGVAKVPDERLTHLAALFKPKKVTPATIEYVDVAGLRRGDADSGLALADLRNADALLHVVRAFQDPDLVHSEGDVNPARDIDTMEMSLILSDLDIAQKRRERLQLSIRKTKRPEEQKELALVERTLEALEEEKALRGEVFTPQDQKILRGFAFLSARPILHLINLGEDDIGHLADFREHFGLEETGSRPGTGMLPLSARIEQEIAELPAADAAEFQNDLGIPEPCRPRVIQASYDLLGLISFFTVGEDECRAWSIPRGTPARRAAGAIHSDIEKGFIRAETCVAAELLEAGSLAALREKAGLRLEGKEYEVKDGDVINFRFNV
ncbi:MAG: redox-regulated ATPase YchF [Acidobacteria bacterium]|nr:redox-regulated ATPase YchF [Acidobacteriota bacterium]